MQMMDRSGWGEPGRRRVAAAAWALGQAAWKAARALLIRMRVAVSEWLERAGVGRKKGYEDGSASSSTLSEEGGRVGRARWRVGAD